MVGAQVQAGVLLPDGNSLTTKARQEFIEGVINELDGTGNIGFCGPTIVPIDSRALQRLRDETEFPEFHRNWLGPDSSYLRIAKLLDVVGQPILPVADLFAFFDVPGIPEFPPELPVTPDVLINFPERPSVSLPDLDIIAKFPPPVPPDIPLPPLPFPPDLPIDLRFTALIDLVLAQIEIPVLEFPQIPISLIAELPGLMGPDFPLNLFELFCGTFADAMLSGVDPRFLMQIAATKVLANKVGDCVTYAATGTVMGVVQSDAPGFGVVGQLGETKGLGRDAEEEKVQQEIIEEKEEIENEEEQLRENARILIEKNVPSGYGGNDFDQNAVDPDQLKFQDITQRSIAELRDDSMLVSTCGYLIHWLLHRLGCRDDLIINRDDAVAGLKFRERINISKLRQGAAALGAKVKFVPGQTRPKLGDIIYIEAAEGFGRDPQLGRNDGTSMGDTKTAAGDYVNQHVMVFLDETELITGEIQWRTADAGQGGKGTQKALIRTNRKREGDLLKWNALFGESIERRIVEYIDISKLPYTEPPNLG